MTLPNVWLCLYPCSTIENTHGRVRHYQITCTENKNLSYLSYSYFVLATTTLTIIILKETLRGNFTSYLTKSLYQCGSLHLPNGPNVEHFTWRLEYCSLPGHTLN